MKRRAGERCVLGSSSVFISNLPWYIAGEEIFPSDDSEFDGVIPLFLLKAATPYPDYKGMNNVHDLF
jgi:hypothetical protein